MSENSSDIRPNAVLILTTNGGIADSAYKIARLLQKSHENLFLFIPSFCKSAGTLIALGASELYLTELSELGPLDVQLFQQDELFKSRSGLVVRTAFEGLAEEAFKLYEHIMIGIKTKSGSIVSFETASRIASNITTDMMGKVYSQINPEILGSDLRNLHIATEYGHRLAIRGMNVREGAIQALISGYPSHEFVIDDAECEKLFHRVRRPSPTLDGLMMRLGEIVYYEQQTHVVRRLNGVTAPKEKMMKHEKSNTPTTVPAWMLDAKRRGEAIQREAVKQNRVIRRAVTAKKSKMIPANCATAEPQIRTDYTTPRASGEG